MQKLVATGVSARKIALIIEPVKDEPELLESGFTPSQLLRAYRALFDIVRVVDELPVIAPLDRPQTFRWEYASFPILLNYYVGHCEAFRYIIATLYQSSPCTPEKPWSLVF